MTIAEVRYLTNTYNPDEFFVISCDAGFIGEESKRLSDKWDYIKYQKRDLVQALIESLKKEIENNDKTISELTKEYKRKKKWFRPWKTKEQKDILCKICELESDNFEKAISIRKEKDSSHVPPEELLEKAHDMLFKYRFRLTQHNISVSDYVYNIEIWERND